MTKPSKNGHKTAHGKFAPGNRLGRGRPAGGRNKASLAVEALLNGEADAPTRTAVELALKGDTTVLRVTWNAFARPDGIGACEIRLASHRVPGDAVAATGAILSAVATGQAAPGEAQTIVAVIDAHRAWSSSRTMSGV